MISSDAGPGCKAPDQGRSLPKNKAVRAPASLVPHTDHAKRFAAIFHRRLTSPWNEKKEIRPFRAMHKLITEEDLALVERMYRVCWPPSYGRNALRHDLATLINNWQGEVDKAKIWAEKHPPKTAYVPRKIVPLPPQQEEEMSQAEREQAEADFMKLVGRRPNLGGT